MTKIDIEAMRDEILIMLAEVSLHEKDIETAQQELLDLFLVMLSKSRTELKRECGDIAMNEEEEYIRGFSCGVNRLTAIMEDNLHSA